MEEIKGKSCWPKEDVDLFRELLDLRDNAKFRFIWKDFARIFNETYILLCNKNPGRFFISNNFYVKTIAKGYRALKLSF